MPKKYLLLSKLVRILRVLDKGAKGAVRAHGKVSGEFDIITGVRQGDALAPALFNLFFDAVIAAITSTHPNASVRMLHGLKNQLVGSRRKMRGGSQC